MSLSPTPIGSEEMSERPVRLTTWIDLGQLEDRLLDALHGVEGLAQRHRRDLERLHDDRSLVHGRQELGAQGRDQRRSDRQQRERSADHDGPG